MPSVRREIAGTDTSVKCASTMLSHFENKMLSQSTSTVDVLTIRVSAVFGCMAVKLACVALSMWAHGVVATFWLFCAVAQSAYMSWFVICDGEGHMQCTDEWGICFALRPVSPHPSHIVVCIREQLLGLWPFGSSVPWPGSLSASDIDVP